jgi:hypothetical protein
MEQPLAVELQHNGRPNESQKKPHAVIPRSMSKDCFRDTISLSSKHE